MSTTLHPIEDVMSDNSTPGDRLQLTSGELDGMQEQLRYAQKLLSNIICMSEHHAWYFRRCQKHEAPSPDDLDVLEEQARMIMEKGEFVFSLIEGIDQDLETRYESQFKREFDDLMASLESNNNQDRS